MRAALKGWGANQGREDKLLRARLVADLARMDAAADSQVFSEQDWAQRYAVEAQVESLLRAEEYWCYAQWNEVDAQGGREYKIFSCLC